MSKHEGRIKEILSEILSLDVSQINSETNIDNTPSWDSLNYMRILTTLEAEFKVVFEPEEAIFMIGFDDIVSTMDDKLG